MSRNHLRKIWEDRIASYRASGLKQYDWCLSQKLKVSQLRYWIRMFNKEESIESKTAKWISVKIDESQPETIQVNSMKIRIGKVTIDIEPEFNKKLLIEVVRTLGELC